MNLRQFLFLLYTAALVVTTVSWSDWHAIGVAALILLAFVWVIMPLGRGAKRWWE